MSRGCVLISGDVIVDRGLESKLKAKHVFLWRLGLIEEDAPISNEIHNKYMHLFKRPPGEDVMQAFDDFFDWNIFP